MKTKEAIQAAVDCLQRVKSIADFIDWATKGGTVEPPIGRDVAISLRQALNGEIPLVLTPNYQRRFQED